MRFAVLYICTGKYNRFFTDFYESAKAHLLKDVAEVEYFVFTDDKTLCSSNDVHLIYRECQGFPADTLKRFEMFMSIRDHLEKFDYICFFNSNALLTGDVGREILPEEGMKVVRWIGLKPCNWSLFYPYERNKRSKAYVKPYNGPYAYYMGGFYCGKSEVFLRMTEELDKAICEDSQRGIIARHNDESHLNRYLHEHPHEELSRGYCCAEERLSDDFETRVVFRNKVTVDNYFDKGRSHSTTGRLTHGVKTLWTALKWYI
ncbi:Glycosyltransferase family 6 [Xylanibacter ruminicola]|jgi:hypothetical protein|uniref:Glycosyltransferase family 6 n=1 Tax=Xylanibacter ruminicola TaxID=839 RepID=A0A1H5S8X7_XYLRU|nr:hypothetical protein [Xylanibacter ruminicola]SEF47012.1 Glycosyltransferase family 6 [Xylanibacter ruminicola]